MNEEYINMWGANFARPVLVANERWNGWVIPYFRESDLPELVEYLSVQEFTGAPFSVESFGVRGSHADVNCCNPVVSNYLECLCVCCECVDTFEWEEFNGERVVSVGGGAWCWSSSTREELASEIINAISDKARAILWDLLLEDNHRTGNSLSGEEFILLMNSGNGWSITDSQEFERALFESAQNLAVN
jgi:hypothetical protein